MREYSEPQQNDEDESRVDNTQLDSQISFFDDDNATGSTIGEKKESGEEIPEETDHDFEGDKGHLGKYQTDSHERREANPTGEFLTEKEEELNAGRIDENEKPIDSEIAREDKALPEGNKAKSFNTVDVPEESFDDYKSTIAPTEEVTYTDSDGVKRGAKRHFESPPYDENGEKTFQGKYEDENGNVLNNEDLSISTHEGSTGQNFVIKQGEKIDDSFNSEYTFTARQERMSLEELQDDPAAWESVHTENAMYHDHVNDKSMYELEKNPEELGKVKDKTEAFYNVTNSGNDWYQDGHNYAEDYKNTQKS